MKLRLTFGVTPAALLAYATLAVAQDPAVVSSDVYRVALENEHVRVLEMTLPPGASDEMHSHPHMFIYYLQDGEVRITTEDGSQRTAVLTAGGHFWQEPTTHRITNISDTEIKVVAFEIREPLNAGIELEHDPAKVAPALNTLIFENDFIRIIETISPPGGGGTLHDHMNMTVYAVSASDLEITPANGEARRASIPAGAAVWIAGPTLHRVKNVGDTASHLLHVEIK